MSVVSQPKRGYLGLANFFPVPPIPFIRQRRRSLGKGRIGMKGSSAVRPEELEAGGLSSFANLLQMLLGFDETEEDFSPASYLSCLGLTPNSAPKPTHPFHFPLGFGPEGPMPVLPAETADRMEAAFAELRAVRHALHEGVDDLPAETVAELAEQAMGAVRGLATALGYRRWDSGESLVQMLQLRKVLTADDLGGAELVQAIREIGTDCYVWEDLETSNRKAPVTALRLVFRLPEAERVEESTPRKLREWREPGERLAAVHNAVFPGDHCIIEFRDASGATAWRGQPTGPPYAEVMARRGKRQGESS